eukprot:TRINITY_DN840_c0_g1_i8.p1 TRINITY_DN840_c0_g1~~TRINITY_DN840_c0_g1_i8.p1  ORF type:complete len:984 (+),score=242.41 TRINITY_DN840_c0_g1_i8:324-2954(+)
MNILRQNPDNEQIAEAVNRCLKNLAKNARLAQMVLARMGGKYDPFADSLKNHVEVKTLHATCSIIGVLAKDAPKEQIEKMGRAGIHTGLCGVITKYKGDADLLAAACEALHRFGDNAKFAPQIMHSGAMEEILKEVALHPEKLQLVKPAVALIAGLCRSSPEAVEMLKKMGAVDVLVQALEAHPYNDELLASAADALKHLTGATDMGLALAGVTKGDTALDAKTAAALSRIAALMLVDDNVDYLHKHAGVEWLTSILKSAVGKEGPVVSKILANGCRILQRAAKSPAQTYDILKKGGVQVLTSILNGHMGDDKAVEAALTALAKLVTRKENAVYIAQCGGIKAAISALHEHPHNEQIARAALDLFDAMAAYPEMGETMQKAGVIKSVMDILKNHMDNPEIALSAIKTLGKLATSQPNVEEMLAQGLLPTLLGVLKRHPDDPELDKNVLLAMETACLVPDAQGKLRNLGALGEIKNCMANHPDDDEINEIGGRLCDGLSVDPLQKQREAEAAAAEEEKLAEEKAAKQRAEVAAKEKEKKVAAEKAAEQKRAEQEKARKIKEAEEGRQRAEREEQQKLEAEMQNALEAMKASSEAARMKALEEQKRAKDLEKARIAAEEEARRLKALDEQRKLEDIEKKRRELELMRKKAAEKHEEDLADKHLFKLAARDTEKQKEPEKKPKLKKSARELFEPDDEKDKKLAILPIPIKNFLLAGQLLRKHSKKAQPKPKHLYLSHDLEWLCWKDPNKAPDIKQRMKIYKLFGVNTGRCTPQLQRKRLGRYLAKEECCFSIYGADSYKDERTVDLEAPTPKECQAWVHALEVLIEYAKNRTLWGQGTVAVRTDKELDKMGFKDKEDEGVVWGGVDPDDEEAGDDDGDK